MEIFKNLGQNQQKVKFKPTFLKTGTLVYTRWTDGHFYPGQVDRAIDPGDGDDAGKFSVLFDDGHLYEANRCDIIVCDLVPMNSSVMADRSESDLPPQVSDNDYTRDGVVLSANNILIYFYQSYD